MSLLFKKQTVAYHDLVQDLQTGDIVLMHGLYLSSHLVETIEHSNWSHSAIVILASDLGIESDENVLLWESNIKQGKKKFQNEIVEDVFLKDEKNGPQLVSFRERMKLNYKHKDDGAFAVRHLYIERTPEFFNDFRKKVIDVYDPNGANIGNNEEYTFPDFKHEMLDPIKGRFFNKDIDNKSIFCSELVALTYRELGLLSGFHPANSYIPADFSEKNSTGLLKRAWLGNEILIEPKSL